MGFDRLFDVLKKVQARYPAFSKRLHEAAALGRWETAVGPGIAKHSRAIRVQDGVLWVEVDHPIWMTELHHRKRQILDLLNQTVLLEPDPGAPAVASSHEDAAADLREKMEQEREIKKPRRSKKHPIITPLPQAQRKPADQAIMDIRFMERRA